MCGITGFWSFERCVADLKSAVQKMADALYARGPDDSGIWVDPQQHLALGHRRLSVLELSSAGHQPMLSACSRYVVVFNGEIYNHLELRAQINSDHAYSWRSHSDTETLLACFASWGVEKTLKATVGMFALALWDRENRSLTLARDRLGEKPLYWGWQNDVLLFGSELKAIKAHPACDAQVDRNVLTLLLRHGYIPAPYSIYRGVQKLKPGHYITIPLTSVTAAQNVESIAYWRFNDAVTSGLSHPFNGTDTEAIAALEQQLKSSISAQMLSDVPLGAFLSGGIDSSTIVALMQTQCTRPVKTFTIGFEEAGYDETQHARAVARHLGTEHTELYIRPQDALHVIPELPTIYCEPFADSSQIPMFLVSQLARRHVTVALTGDAGDELFGGYNTYQFTPMLWNKIRHIPLALRRGTTTAFERLPLPTKAYKLLNVLNSENPYELYRKIISHWAQPSDIVIGASEPQTLLTTPMTWPKTDSFQHWMMAMESQMFMADDILVKVDRAAMANSLETRAPMLDQRVVELAWQFPSHMKIRDNKGKWLLRQVLYRHVPKMLIERPKMGFSIPLASWLRGPLRDWADDLLSEKRLQSDGYFYPRPIRTLWEAHVLKRRDCSTLLWNILMFQSWLRAQSMNITN